MSGEIFADGEYQFKLGDQWYYRGNRSPKWLFVASRADGSCQGGICESVPIAWWPLLNQIGERLSSAAPASEYICKCGVRVEPHRCATGTEF